MLLEWKKLERVYIAKTMAYMNDCFNRLKYRFIISSSLDNIRKGYERFILFHLKCLVRL